MGNTTLSPVALGSFGVLPSQDAGGRPACLGACGVCGGGGANGGLVEAYGDRMSTALAISM